MRKLLNVKQVAVAVDHTTCIRSIVAVDTNGDVFEFNEWSRAWVPLPMEVAQNEAVTSGV